MLRRYLAGPVDEAPRGIGEEGPELSLEKVE